MGVSRGKYRRVSDLYVDGTELVLEGDVVIWLQVLNAYEIEEARGDAQAARARLVLALRSEDSDEVAKVHARYEEDGRSIAIETLVEARSERALPKVIDAIHNDPEWTERLEIVARADGDDDDRPPSEEEQKVIEDINLAYVKAVQEGLDDERSWLRSRFEAMDDDQLKGEYVDLYIDRRGTEVAVNEYKLAEVYRGARACDAVRDDEGNWSHRGCEGHRMRAFESKQEVRELPDRLQQAIFDAYTDLSMDLRTAKNSDRQGSSSDSSPLPSEPEESTPSTPVETQDEPPGISPQPSTTP